MARGRPLRELRLSPAEREQLVAVTRSRSMPHSLVNRARIILLAAEGWSNVAIAAELGCSLPTVGTWRQRYLTQRTFRNVRELVAKIDDFVRHYNQRCHPFMWTATADSILQKIERLCKAVAGTQH